MTDSPLLTFLAKVRPSANTTVTALDDAVREAGALDAAIKWGKLTYAKGDDFHHWICATSVSKNQVTLTFHFGGLLPDPDRSFREGSSKFLRMLDFTSPESIDTALVAKMVGYALNELDYFKANWKAISDGGLAPRRSSADH